LSGGNSTVVNNTYLNSRVVEKVAGSIGGIQRLTVAVLVNTKAIEKVTPGANQAAELARYEQVVRDAIGIDSARGDRVTVSAMPFEPIVIALDSSSAGGGAGQVLVVAERFSRPLIAVVGIIAALILALKVLRPVGGGSGGGGGSFPGQPADRGAFPGGQDIELPPVPVTAISATTTRLKNEVQAESTARPETAAQVMKTWLAEST
jgi:flagellar M-ring protein FliF